MAVQVLTHNLSQPLTGAATARVDINVGDGNLAIDCEIESSSLLASGQLEYTEKQGKPFCSLDSSNGQAILTLKAGSAPQRWLRLPWAACNGAYGWAVHLNPAATTELQARSNGGNVKVNLAGTAANRVALDNGGGNVELILPGSMANLNAVVRSGAGNVTVEIGAGITGNSVLTAESGAGNVTACIPGDVAARIKATSGAGKVIPDPRFVMVDKNMYQTADYDAAADKLQVTLKSGAGNVRISSN
ncbi:MAG: DUF4097 family beta strand repeat-containing protein [Anaerolineae bacterium]